MKQLVCPSIFSVITLLTTHILHTHSSHLPSWLLMVLWTSLWAGRVSLGFNSRDSWEAPHMFPTEVVIISSVFSVELLNRPLPGSLENNFPSSFGELCSCFPPECDACRHLSLTVFLAHFYSVLGPIHGSLKCLMAVDKQRLLKVTPTM